VAAGSYVVPDVVSRSGASVLDLRASRRMRAQFRSLGPIAANHPANRTNPVGPYCADDLKQAYQYPSYQTANGKGASVAIAAGGDFSESDQDPLTVVFNTLCKKRHAPKRSRNLQPPPNRTRRLFLLFSPWRNGRLSLNNKSLLVGAALSALFLIPTQQPSQAAAGDSIGRANPAQGVEFAVHLPLRESVQLDQLIHLQGTPASPLYHHFLTPQQFRATFAPSATTVRRAVAALQAHALVVTSVESQLIHVRGLSANVERAFGTRLNVARDAAGRTSISADRALTVPAELAALNASIAGLTSTVRPQPLAVRAAPNNRYSNVGPYWFDDLKQAYDYPAYSVANGKGVTIATVGNGDFSDSDTKAYFRHEKLGSGGLAQAPVTKHLILPGGPPFDPNSNTSFEANLDVQQSGGSAPGATIVGVDIGNNVGGFGEPFLNAYSYLVEQNVADVVSTSYGACELFYTAPYTNGIDQRDILLSYHDLFRQGNSQGITFVFSSGDYSGLGCAPPGYITKPKQAKAYPALPGAGIWVDDPNATGVGGTNLITSYNPGKLTSTYVSENEIGDRIASGGIDTYGTGNTIVHGLWGSGSGASVIFAKPTFQNLVNTGAATRDTPDVSMQMGGCPGFAPPVVVACDPNRDSAVIAALGGQLYGAIGTSASAPEFAGLLAVKIEAGRSRLGNENEDLYQLAHDNTKFGYSFFHQGIYAYNGVVHVKPGQLGYSPIIGVGTPIAKNFVRLPLAELAGDPQTLSNP